jgi:flagellar biosynthesis protein FlhF
MRRDVPRRVFRGRDLVTVSAQARSALGDDALVLRTSRVRLGAASLIEIVAAPANDVARFRKRLTPAPLMRLTVVDRASSTGSASTSRSVSAPPSQARDKRPVVLALVGPTGAGKTTTAVKLAINPAALGRQRVGFITLDTYRAGAIAQLETYASVAALPLEVVYEARDVEGAMVRLSSCDVVIVDTPGRGPKTGDDAEWRTLLAALAPDEVHLVIPATLRADIADAVRQRMSIDAITGDALDVAPTHVLLTKVDEVPDETGVANLASMLDLPVRWITDGQSIPNDLADGVPRLVNALAAGAPLAESAGYAEAWA